MTEVLFYHLQRQPLEAVLPGLLEKTLERNWRAVVQAGSAERVAALDAHLWTFSDESFLPHGTDAEPEGQPVVLTAGEGNPNGATVRFFVDGAVPAEAEAYQRVVIIFDGNDPAALESARAAWRTMVAAGHAATYWQQNGEGRWEKRAG
ncbi:MAG: DNA polymerase III subunit chi [Bauldia sp.]|nr:DNA polymerase III subunit chi [Bauldia sp.]